MTQGSKPTVGSIAWTDLTVADAQRLREFYASVVGWQPEPVDMGGYSDFSMNASDGTATAGVCHARGSNADLPAQWLIYIVVADLEQSLARSTDLGGEMVTPPRSLGASGRCCVIRDPAGAEAALYQPSR